MFLSKCFNYFYNKYILQLEHIQCSTYWLAIRSLVNFFMNVPDDGLQ
jgi:hypothetical protein